MGGKEGIRRLLMKGLEGLEVLFYPPYCAVCDQPVEPPLPSAFICRPCLAGLPFRMDREAVAWQGPCPLYASFYYRPPLPKLIVSLKFSDRTDRARLLAPFLARTLLRRVPQAHAIVPVPLHKKRQRERGYNQALLLAQSLSDALDIPLLEDLLIRQVHTRRQSETQSVRERQAQMQGAFCLKEDHELLESLRGRPVILLDDVLTTGATLAQAAKSLQGAGLEVTGLVAASSKDAYQVYGQAIESYYN